MADNTSLNPGAGGDLIATDEVVDGTLGTVKVQYVKLMDGTLDGTTKAAISAAGLKVDLGADNDVTVTTVPAPLSTTGGGTEAAALRVTIASDSTGVLSVDDNGSSISVDDNGSTISIDDGGSTISIDDGASSITVDGTVTANLATGTNTVGNVGVIPRTTGGLTTFHLISAGSTNATVVKASAGQLFGWFIYNASTAHRKVAFHNSASSPTAGASIFFTLSIPPGGGANVMSDIGIAFSSGIAITTTTGIADADNAAVTASDLNINLFYS